MLTVPPMRLSALSMIQVCSFVSAALLKRAVTYSQGLEIATSITFTFRTFLVCTDCSPSLQAYGSSPLPRLLESSMVASSLIERKIIDSCCYLADGAYTHLGIREGCLV